MDFSETYRFSGPAPVFSPDGNYLATIVEYRLVVRDTESLKVAHIFSCLDKIHSVSWSENSKYICCALHNRSVVQAWCPQQPDWACRIDEGPGGIQHVRWSGDGLSILVVAEFQVHMTAWSLTDRCCTHLAGPKYPDRALTFSPDKKFMAVAERANCKDTINIYHCRNWTSLNKFTVDTSDLTDISWAPSGNFIAVWDSPLTYNLLIYSPEGSCLARYSAYANALGIKTTAWSPGGSLICVGSYDQRLRLLPTATWQPLLEADHPSRIGAPSSVVVYRELEELRDMPGGASAAQEVRSRYIICELPTNIPTTRPPLDKPNPKLGVGVVTWSPDGSYLASVNDCQPCAVWVWDLAAMALAAVLVHASPIKDLQWAPQGTTLAMVSGSTKVYLWSPAGASIVHIPLRSFLAHQLTWAAGGSAFMLRDRDAFCIAYITANEQ